MNDEPKGARDPRDDAAGPEGVDLRRISVGRLLHAASRLSLGSALLLVGLAGTLFGTGVGIGRDRASDAAQERIATLSDSLRDARAALAAGDRAAGAGGAFAESFTTRLASESTHGPIVRSMADERPDGLSSYDDVRAALLWQAKAQRGFVEMLSGETAWQVQIVFEEDAVSLDWNERASVVPRILEDLGLPAAELSRVNAELNRFGVAALDGANYVVRTLDGGLAVVGG